MQVKKKVRRAFCVFMFFFATLLDSSLRSSDFLVASLGLSLYGIVSSANRDSFTSFPSRISFISFFL